METKTIEDKSFQVKEGRTIISVPHLEDKVSFAYPAFRGTYGNVANEIDKAGLKRPNSAETASLVYDAWKNQKGEKESEIISILKNNWLWEYTGNLYLPKSNEEISNGVILEINPKIINGKLAMDKNSLVQRLKENDPLVKFVPFGFKTGTQDLIEFQKNKYIIERYGKEGAEKIAEVASKYKNNPYIWSFNSDSVNEEKTRMSVLSSYWDFGDGLVVNGDGWYDYDGGHAFGVEK